MTYKNSIKKYIVTHITVDNKHEDDYVVKSMGSFGVWQGFICLLASLTRVIAGWNIITIVYLTPNTEFVCTDFEREIPKETKNSTCYDGCVKYGYYNTMFETTLLSEFDLICDRAWLASFTQTILMFGLFIGGNLFGWASDRYGRRLSLVLSVATPVLFSIAAPFAPDYWTFSILRFFVGLGCGGIFAVSIVIIIETIGPKYREFGGGMGLIIDGIGQATLVIFAYYSSTWRMFLLSLGLTSIAILMSLIFMPETPRWLIANKHSEKAVELMTKIAKFKNLNTDNIKENVEMAIKDIEEKQKYPKTNPNFLDLFRTKELALITIFSTIIWSVAGACFFGINQYVTLLGSNVNLIVLVSGLVQVPGTLLGVLANKCSGRKISTFLSTLTSGIVMAALIFTPDGYWSSVTLAIVGLMSSVTTITIIHVQDNELYPTVLRNMGFGVSSGGAQFAGMIAPFISPATLLGMVVNKLFGRKLSSFFLNTLTGVVMGVIPFLPAGNWGIVTLAIIGIFLSSALYTVLVVQVTELFPTSLRCQAYGVNSGGAKIGACVAPFIANIHPHWMSSVVFSIAAFAAAGFGLLLPETKGLQLKDVMGEKVIPAALVGMGINRCFGRRVSSGFFLFLTGIAMGFLTFLPDGSFAAALAVTALFSSVTVFTIVYVQVTELYPTLLRNTGFAVSSSGSKTGAMVAPFIVNVKPHWISSITFSLVPLVGSGICLLLPETKGKALKDIV